MVQLPSLGGNGDSALDVNNSGDVAGSSNGHAVMWRSATTLEDLGVLGRALFINDAGQVVGQDLFTNHGFIWSEGDDVVDLGTLPGGNSATPPPSVRAAMSLAMPRQRRAPTHFSGERKLKG